MVLREIVLGVALWFCIAQIGLAQTDPGVGAGATFNFGAGARALGMGGAFVALADDYSAPYWNAAGLTQIETLDIGAMNTNKHERGIQYNYIGTAGALHLPLSNLATLHGAGGAALTISSIGSIETFGPGGESTGTTTSIESSLIGSLAGGLRVGFLELSASRSVKRYAFSLGGESALEWSADYGVFVDLFDVVSLGYAKSDLGGTDITWSAGAVDVISSRSRAGAALHLVNDTVISTGQVDFAEGFDVLTRRWGLELNLFRLFKTSWFPADMPWWLIPLDFSLRTGAKITEGSSQATYGVGFGLFSWLDLDAALVINHTLGNSLIASVHAEF